MSKYGFPIMPNFPNGLEVGEAVKNSKWYIGGECISGVLDYTSAGKERVRECKLIFEPNLTAMENEGYLYITRDPNSTPNPNWQVVRGYKYTGTSTNYEEIFQDGKSTGNYATYVNEYKNKLINSTYSGAQYYATESEGGTYKESYFDTNLPIFEVNDTDGINNYVNNGDISSAINKDDLLIEKVMSTVYVDGTSKPNMKITHNIDGGEPPKTYTIKCEVKGLLSLEYETLFEKTYEFTDSSYMTTWGNLETSWGHLILEIKFSMYYNNKTSETLTANIKNDGSYYPNNSQSGKHYLQVKKGSGEDDDGYADTINDSNATDENITVNTCDLLTSTYKVTVEQLHALGNFLWQDSFISNIKLLNTSPIENIVSCKAIPINIDGESTTIGLGNIDSGVSGLKISSNYLKTTIGSIDVPNIYNNFVDYEYSSVDLYLPLIGTITDLNPREVVGYKITLKYCFDVVSGDCLAMLFNNRGGGTNCIGVYKGNCGIDIPLTASNRAQIQAGYVSDVIGGTLSVASGHPFGAIMAGMNAITRQNVAKSSGSISGVTAQGLPKQAYLTIVENATQIPSNYAETYGRPCNLTKKLKNVSGFTVVDKNIRLSNINCTYEEKEEIRKLLSEGVIF